MGLDHAFDAGPTLLAVTWVHPSMLAGLVLLAVPLAIHLASRRLKRRVTLPSLTPLDPAQDGVAPRRRRGAGLWRWLRLAGRLLIVTLVVLAFARPLPGPAERAAAASGDVLADRPPRVTLVIDRSASTRRSIDGVPLFDTLRSKALQRADALALETPLRLVWLDAWPSAFPETGTARHDVVRRAILEATPSWEAGDAASAMALAQAGGQPGDKIVVISDLQAADWAAGRDGLLPATAGTGVEVLAPPAGTDRADLAALEDPSSVDLTPRPRVVVVSDQPAAGPSDPGYLTAAALAPFGDRRDPFDVRTLRAESWDERPSGAVALWVWVASEPPSGGAIAALDDYLRAGGHVLLMVSGSEALAGWPWVGPAPPQATPRSRRLGSIRDRIGPLAGAGSSIVSIWPALRDVRFEPGASVGLAETRGPGDDATGVWMRFDTGEPAMVSRRVGAGRFTALGFAPRPPGTDLPANAGFVALMHRLAESAAGITEGAVTYAGQALKIPLSAAFNRTGASPRVVGPGGDEVFDVSWSTGQAGRPPAVTVARPEAVGAYRVVQDDRVVGRGRVKIDPAERTMAMIAAEAPATRDAAGHAIGVATERMSHGITRRADAATTDRGWAWLVASAMLLVAVDAATGYALPGRQGAA